MATTIKLKNSVVKDKVPLPSGLEIGELAVGAHSESPALFFKDNADNTIKLEPGGSGVEPSPTPPVGPDEGDLWYDTGKNTLNYWDGASWVELGQAGDSPVTSVNGEVGVVVLDAADVGALAPGDNVSELANDAGYLTGADGDGFVNVDGDNMTGNLTLGTDKILLDADTGNVIVDGLVRANGIVDGVVSEMNNGTIKTTIKEGNTQSLFVGIKGAAPVFDVKYDGSAIFASKVTANSFDIEALPALPA